MHRLASIVVSHTKFIILLFVIATIAGGIMALGIQVNLDNVGYLPDKSEAKQATILMEEEFYVYGTANLMIYEPDPLKVDLLTQKIEYLPEVRDVIWINDSIDIRTPVSSWDRSLLDTFYRDGYARLNILFTDKNDSPLTHEGVRRVRELSGTDAQLSGPAIISLNSVERINREIPFYTAIAVVLILILLFISTSSWLEPFLILISIGSSIVINSGLNLISGEVSQITFASAPILQLAVSMDYSVFMLHRFHEQRAKGDGVKEAMVNAMTLSAAPVLASALTTVAGFAALLLMDFGIGGDMGRVLARGVLLSLVSVLTFLPALVILTDKWLERWTHRDVNIPLKTAARLAVKGRKIIVPLVFLFTFVFFLAQSRVDHYYGMEHVLPYDDPSLVALRSEKAVFGDTEQSMLIFPQDNTANEPALVAALYELSNVVSVDGIGTGPLARFPEEMLSTGVTKRFASDNSRMLLITTKAGTETPEAFSLVTEIRESARTYAPGSKISGAAFTFKDLQDFTGADSFRVSIASAIFIFLIMAVAFRSISLPAIAVFLIQSAIWINVGLVYFFQTPMSFISFIIIGAIQLGATVDYAILFISRYKENMVLMRAVEAARQTVSDTAKSILTSAMILVSATFSVHFIATIRTASELTLFIGRGALISTFLVLFVLPGLLVMFNPFIRATTIGWPRAAILKGGIACAPFKNKSKKI